MAAFGWPSMAAFELATEVRHLQNLEAGLCSSVGIIAVH
jgi:hypothetical protein